ncbi:MAG: DNA polymerase III subunit beta [Clostridia bacterium]|nr:DNA polymerase III subunit beta [Clostridia bacterium]
MRLRVNQEDLHKALQITLKASSPTSTLPILGAVLLRAWESTLALTTTNLELSVRLSITAEVEEEGEIALPARDLADLARFLPPGPLFIQSDPDAPRSVLLSRGDSRWKINGYPVEDFPGFPAVTSNGFSLPVDFFRSAVQKGGAAVARDDTGRVFNGIFIEADAEGTLHVVSTDTHRLAYAWGKVLDTPLEPWSILVPGKNLLDMIRLLSREQFLFGIAENACTLSTKDFETELRLLEGRFPAYQQVIPKKWQTRIEIDAGELAASVQRALVIGRPDDKTKTPVLRLKLSGQSVSVESAWQERGEMHEELPAKIEGEELEIAFNARYLLDGLQAVGAEEVVIEFNGPTGPAIIRPRQEKEVACLYLVLPVRLR